ncbi:MATE family efflux transporter [Rubrobacter tropicus]|uniref:oligosaccharide flippase family protein n=1 Tax=Rubrobacter tropicus TaxID=2653851 RepID=UPI00140960DD|nr:oligosaccharide flippase family protein [Rubrobacter tropicus]
MADQGLFATSNFALNILLARWLPPTEYGAFGLAFAVFTFVGCLHAATLTEPMLVFSPRRYKECVSEYLGALVYGHIGFATLGSLALLVTGLVFAYWDPSSTLPSVFFALALTEPFIHLLWMMRRACYARFEPQLAAWGGAWYMVMMLVGAFMLYRYGWLSTSTALGVMAISSLVVSLWLGVRLGVKAPPLRGGVTGEALKSHWEYGRWSVGNRALYWLPTNVYYLILPVWGGLEAGAAFKALMNLLMPMLQATTALSALLLPTFVQAREQDSFGSSVRSAFGLLLIAPILYWVLLGLFHETMINLAYGGRYAAHADLLWLLGLLPIAMAANEVLSQAIRSLERPEWLFRVYVVYAVVGGTLGVWCMYLWLIAGAGIGILFSRIVLAVSMAIMLLVLHRRSRGDLFSAPTSRKASDSGS